jgi:pyrroline-5-carboxylate reductase
MADATRFGFIGAGKMATALCRGWLAAGLITRDACRAGDPDAEVREQFLAATGVGVGKDNLDVVRASDVVVIAVKPQNVPEILEEIEPELADRHLVVSIAAGVTLSTLSGGLGADRRIIRVMPNTACIVQAGAAAYAGNPAVTPRDFALVERLLNVVGRAYEVPEPLLDAITGLSGSGPAFVYAVIEAMSDGGVLAGLPRTIATALAAQTVLGAAKMVLETGRHPAVLKDEVASPAGTTIAGLQALERSGVRAGLIDAVAAAARRSRELGASE